ncbi:unnamed protein product [Periconia digitata]|uniref:BTB domain-containing protein n=1 Tax=Periconia digitata TaxID=1303443 RepID=A0A9W4UH46_9PLEO|nr:unnamed protein product [Periconia digitata]
MSSFANILGSKLFTFLVGKLKQPVVVHSAAFAELSGPMYRLINGHMLEANENTAHIQNINLHDFNRVAELAYSGNYTAPSTGEPSELDEYDEDESDQESPTSENLLEYLSLIPVKAYGALWRRATQVSISVTPAQYFELASNTLCDASQLDTTNYKPSWSGCQTPVLLGHARLYAFASKYLIDPLKPMAFTKLARTLENMYLFRPTLTSVMKLASFVYDNDFVPDREGDRIDPIRRLVVSYVVMHYKHFKDFEGHRDLMEEDCEYADDVLEHVGRYLDPESQFDPTYRFEMAKNHVASWL